MKNLCYLILFAFLMTMQSCSTDTSEISDTNSNRPISITAQIDKSVSRLSFEDSENMIKVKWGAAETFSLFSGTASQSSVIFTKDNTDIANSATFTGNVALTDNSNIYAVYPSTTDVVAPANVSVDLSNQDGLLTTIQNKAPMFSSAVYKSSEASSLTFSNAACILRIQLTFPSAVNVSSLTLSSSTLHNKAALDITSASTTSCWTMNDNGKGAINATFSPALATSTDNKITAYLLALPEDFGNISISCSDGSDMYSASLSATAGTLVAGKVYSVTKDMVKEAKTIEYTTAVEAAAGVQPTVGDGTESNPFQLSTPANIKWLKEQVNGVNLTTGKYYKLMCNVKVTSDTWAPMGSNNTTRSLQGVFDGDNHVFTGNLNAPSNIGYYYGIFGFINGGCVKNLVNKAAVTAVSSTATTDIRVGGISGGVGPQSNFTTAIVNCQNYGDIKGLTFAGGIAGFVTTKADAASDFTIISGCKNYGSVSTASTTAKQTPTGGIIGQIQPQLTSGTLKVESCENYGNVTAAVNYAGGLVGIVDATHPVVISSSTEDASVTVQANSTSATADLGTSTPFAGKLWGAIWTPAGFTSTNNKVSGSSSSSSTSNNGQVSDYGDGGSLN